MRVAAAVVVALAAMAAGTACSARPADRMIEFDMLVAEIEEMPGVARVHSRYYNNDEQGSIVSARVEIDDAAAVEQVAAISDLVKENNTRVGYDGYDKTLQFIRSNRNAIYTNYSEFDVGWDGWATELDAPAGCWLEVTSRYDDLLVTSVRDGRGADQGDSGGGEPPLPFDPPRTVLDVDFPPDAGENVRVEEALPLCLDYGGPDGENTVRFRLDGPDIELLDDTSADRALELHRKLAFTERPYAVTEIIVLDGDPVEVTVEAPEGAPVPDGDVVFRDLASEAGVERVVVMTYSTSGDRTLPGVRGPVATEIRPESDRGR